MHTVCDYKNKEPNKTTTVRSDDGKKRKEWVEVKSCLSNNSSSTKYKKKRKKR